MDTAAMALGAAINAGNLEAVKDWVVRFGINTPAVYPVPGAAFDAVINGTPLAIAVHQAKEDIALWLLRNGASQQCYGYSSEAGYSQNHTYHPLGPAVNNGLDSVVKLMLEQGVDFQVEQSHWYEEWQDTEFEVFGKAFLKQKGTRALLERIGRLDVLATLANADLRSQEEREYDDARALV